MNGNTNGNADGIAYGKSGLSVAATSGIIDGNESRKGKSEVNPAQAAQPMSEEERIETQEWLESLEWVLQNQGSPRVAQLLEQLENYAYSKGVEIPFTANTPYINTIPKSRQPRYPGNLDLERKIRPVGNAYRALLEEFGQITIVPHGELFEVTDNPARLKVEV